MLVEDRSAATSQVQQSKQQHTTLLEAAHDDHHVAELRRFQQHIEGQLRRARQLKASRAARVELHTAAQEQRDGSAVGGILRLPEAVVHLLAEVSTKVLERCEHLCGRSGCLSTQPESAC